MNYIDEDGNQLNVQPIFRTLLTGVPVELTESGPTVQKVRQILEKEETFTVDRNMTHPVPCIGIGESRWRS